MSTPEHNKPEHNTGKTHDHDPCMFCAEGLVVVDEQTRRIYHSAPVCEQFIEAMIGLKTVPDGDPVMLDIDLDKDLGKGRDRRQRPPSA